MKRKTTLTYEFADETIQEFTLEDLYKLENMSPELAELLIDMDNDIQRNDKKQTRRHISLSTFDDNINPLKPFQAQQSLEEEMIKKELLEAIETEPSLTEKQKRRLPRYHFLLYHILHKKSPYFLLLQKIIHIAPYD